MHSQSGLISNFQYDQYIDKIIVLPLYGDYYIIYYIYTIYVNLWSTIEINCIKYLKMRPHFEICA
jgi:hypothetical protein